MLEIRPLEMTKMVPVASRVGGQYLESLGKTDLRRMTKAEWHGFLNVILAATWFTQLGDQINLREPIPGAIEPDEIPY